MKIPPKLTKLCGHLLSCNVAADVGCTCGLWSYNEHGAANQSSSVTLSIFESLYLKLYIKQIINAIGFGKHGWRSGYVLASLCDPGSIPVLAVSCGLSLLLVLSLLRGFFFGFSGFPPSTKIDTSKFQFDLDVERLKTRPGDHSLRFPEIK